MFKTQSNRHFLLLLSVVCVLLILALLNGCAPEPSSAPPPLPVFTPTEIIQIETETPTSLPASATPVNTSAPRIIGPDRYSPDTNPLTGLKVADRSMLEHRPLLVKISNAPPVVRPQSGISFADIVFEHYAEGGQTRFSALFYGEGAHHVGSVRSTRLIDLLLAPAFDAVLVFSGGSLGVIDSIRLSDLYPNNVISPQFGVGEPTFVRFPREGLPFEHTLFTDTSQLWAYTAQRRIRQTPEWHTPGPAFSDTAPTGGRPALVAQLDYARTSAEWRFDPLTGRYLRWTDGIPHLDALTGAQLSFANVLVVSAYHDEVDLFPEKYFGTEKSIYIDLLGEGPATLLRDGVAYDGRWHHEEVDDMLSFTSMDGAPLYLKPGKTFVQVIRIGFEELALEP